MQGYLNPKLAAKIAARNTPGYVRTRLTLRFSLLYFTMFVAGLLLCRVEPLATLPAVETRVAALFEHPFAGCTPARDYVRAVLSASRTDLTVLLLIALSGMTFFSTAASEVLLTAHALPFGVLCGGAMRAVMGGNIAVPHANLVFFVYFFSQLALSAVLLTAAAEAVIFSYDYRDACRAQRHQRDTVAVGCFLRTLSMVGTVLLLHTARALILVSLINL